MPRVAVPEKVAAMPRALPVLGAPEKVEAIAILGLAGPGPAPWERVE